ncbi:hypothetical protein F0L74_21400 [Chitinophaga agrisoli]|uniref:Uncharacterized protein n=1 Tax=Chitinophaga agrisoli TaxID=2607653 RepID=A0A5B2VIN7_9BACT|nr:caspase family protein [Chitinophaga agrisoli]KAA2238774.1 hypothetical protein F0L74_21400 [Chitinophaga agrisoli]
MRYDSLPQLEERFRTEAAAFLKPFALPVPNEPGLTLNGVLYNPPKRDYFFSAEHPKQRIVLHFTAGNTRSDMMSLTQDGRHVSVPFVIARDGTIYQLFPSAAWSGHLGAGVGNQGTGNAQDKASIGIEISNYGYLVPRDGNLETVYSRVKNTSTGAVSPPDPYCTLAQKEAYQQITTPFRDQTFYASFTPEQLESVIILLLFLTNKFNIPRQFLPEDKRYITTNDVLQFKGIVSHINYRSSGKWDIGPAFDWAGLIAGVQAPQFVPKAAGTRGLVIPALSSEEEINALFPAQKGFVNELAEATDNEGYDPNMFEDAPVHDEGHGAGNGKLRALLIGINDYDKVNRLTGCLHDVEEMERYLRERSSFSPAAEDIRILRNEEATRANIIEGIHSFLAEGAQPEDTLMLYYSGHGVQEFADPLWEEADDTLECLVCYDGGVTDTADFLLADKELRYLLHGLYEQTKAHIITIFDCCHSGDNTRGEMISAAFNGEMVQSRRVPYIAPRRNWEQFVFAAQLPYAAVQGKKTAEFLPEGAHVQMAACEDDQLSIEINRAGVFTKTLLATLDAVNSNISYSTLRDRIRQSMRFAYDQTPRVYAAKNAPALLAKGFLNQPVDQHTFVSEITFNQTAGWQLNFGAIHGLQKESTVTIVDRHDAQKTYKATIREINVDFAKVDVEGSEQPDTTGAHKAVVKGIMSGALQLELDNVNGHPKDMEQLVTLLQTDADNYYSFASGGQDGPTNRAPDYTLHIRGGDAVLTRPADPYRPMFRPIPLVTADDNELVAAALQQVSRWHFIRNLRNPDLPAGFPVSPLNVQVNQVALDGTKQPATINNDTVTLNYAYDTELKLWAGQVEITITNTTQQPLFVAAVFLSNLFGATTAFLAGDGVMKLEPGKPETLHLDNSTYLELELETYVQEYNWPDTTEHFKFIVSTERFSADALQLDLMEPPYTTDDFYPAGEQMEADRGIKATRGGPIPLKGWTTQHLQIQFINPLYNTISAPTLQALMEHEETAYYASGLYYNMVLDENGQPTRLELKPEITIIAQKGFAGEVGLWLANQVETLVRRKLYKRLKKTDRIRIVAEGDSWFQYPIVVQDTLDHLYRIYAIRSLALAGDTLEHYMAHRDYVAAIGEEEAHIFLVSGGGNDILGSQFEGFLRETPDPTDNTPKRYLQDSFFTKLQLLEDWYVEMFRELLIRYPDLHILSHSYDYIIPVDTEQFPKKKSWLGQYMVKKGIVPQAEREQLIRYILDEFNVHLKRALDQFPDNATYIDARGLVNRESWHDEIHPTNEGFGLIADRFTAAIRKRKEAGATATEAGGV